VSRPAGLDKLLIRVLCQISDNQIAELFVLLDECSDCTFDAPGLARSLCALKSRSSSSKAWARSAERPPKTLMIVCTVTRAPAVASDSGSEHTREAAMAPLKAHAGEAVFLIAGSSQIHDRCQKSNGYKRNKHCHYQHVPHKGRIALQNCKQVPDAHRRPPHSRGSGARLQRRTVGADVNLVRFDRRAQGEVLAADSLTTCNDSGPGVSPRTKPAANRSEQADIADCGDELGHGGVDLRKVLHSL
jgi:hypothetical protein